MADEASRGVSDCEAAVVAVISAIPAGDDGSFEV